MFLASDNNYRLIITLGLRMNKAAVFISSEFICVVAAVALLHVLAEGRMPPGPG